jgi:hypothetical protein
MYVAIESDVDDAVGKVIHENRFIKFIKIIKGIFIA